MLYDGLFPGIDAPLRVQGVKLSQITLIACHSICYAMTSNHTPLSKVFINSQGHRYTYF